LEKRQQKNHFFGDTFLDTPAPGTYDPFAPVGIAGLGEL
jgi:hypothetical protein